MPRFFSWQPASTPVRAWPAAVAVLGLIPGVLLIVAVWQVDADGVSPVTAKWPTWDFTNLWAGGALAASGELPILFDPAEYSRWLRAVLSPRVADHEWSYPPTMLLLGVPLARLPLVPGYLVWTFGTLGLLWIALRAGGLSRAACAAAVLSPAMLNNAALGQNGALTAALLVGALLLADRRPVVAGILMGFLTVKPHLGLLLPVCVVASRNWRALGAAALTALAMVVAAGLVAGWDAWRLFFAVTAPTMRAILEAPWPSGYQVNAVTVFLSVRALGASVPFAYVAQAAAALACAALAWRIWRRDAADPHARMALTVALTLLASPYGYSYDMLALAAGVAALMALGQWRVTALEALVWLWPGLTHFVTQNYFPVSPLVTAAAAWLAWQRLRAPALAPAGLAR
jgi:hypothetical protein